MCKWGTTTLVKVYIDPELACSGKGYWKEMMIDSCIADIVKALQGGGINMLGCCCGHGKKQGRIDLADGRVIKIKERK